MDRPAPTDPPAGVEPDANGPAAAALAVLRRRFLAGLPARWQEVEDAIDPGQRIAALHRLAGAAGSFGLPELGQAARHAEQAVSGPGGPAALADVERLIRQLAVTLR